jgi:Na+-translocating ferredoxin:NAD+ oxidoreductase RnfD subunit
MPPAKVSKFKKASPAMKRLNFALLVLVLAGSIIFGMNVVFLTLVSVISSLVMEIIFAFFREKQIDEGWLMNPLVFVLLIPSTLPVWMAAVGAVFAVFFAKLVFGGYPKYVFNPAVVGVIFLTISFPQFMNSQFLNPVTDVIGTGLPVILFNNGGDVFATYPVLDLFTGMNPGFIGEVSRGLIILLGLFLVVTKTVDWKAPFAFLVSMFGLAYAGFFLGIEGFNEPYIALLVGNVIFASFFLVTDKPTLPVKTFSRFIYGFLFAFFTILIRVYSAWPEGVLFALIIVNTLSPLIDAMTSGKAVSEVMTAEVN